MSGSDPPSKRVIIASVVASSCFVGFGGGVIWPIFPNLGSVLGISPLFVGLILSANRFSRLLSNTPSGSLVDRFGARKPFIAGLGIQAVATLGYIIAVYAPLPGAWFFSARVFHGIGSALVFTTSYTIAADISSDESRGSSIGTIRGASIIGFPMGLLIGGIVSEVSTNSAAFGIACLFAVFATVLAYFTIPETHVENGSNNGIKPWEIDTTLSTLTIGLTNFTTWFAYMGVFFATLVIFLQNKEIFVFGFSAQGSSGVLMGITVFAEAPFMFLGGQISDSRDSRVPSILLFILLLMSGFFILAGSSSVWTVIIACLMMGMGMGGTLGPMMALLADLTPKERMGRASATTNVFSDIGGGLGPVIALPLVGVIDFWVMYTAAALLQLASVVTLVVGLHYYTGHALPATADISSFGEAGASVGDDGD